VPRSLRIALFHNLPSGGAKRTTYEQAKRLARCHKVDLFTLSTAEQEYADIRPFVGETAILPFRPGRLYRSPFGRLNQGVRIVDLLRLRRAMRALAEQINRGGYDVALVQPCMFTYSPTMLRGLRVPSLYFRQDPVRWIHDPAIPRPYRKNSLVGRRLDRIDPLYQGYRRLLIQEDTTSMRAATQVVTNSCFMRESLYRLHGVAPPVCYHGVDAELFRPLGLARRPFVVSAGAISPKKGFDFLIRSLASIPAASRPRLTVASNAAIQEELDYLAQLADDLDVAVDFRYLISDKELVRLYNQAVCTVFAPVMEPFGLVPLESMACGTPVVGIREGGVRETVIDGETGFLVDRDPTEFAAAIVRLLDDPVLAGRLGRQGRACVEERWGWEDAVARLEAHLQRVFSSGTIANSPGGLEWNRNWSA
jgi:glycosyltransferase involved in cell wall biosynthesis